jgi:hypothetical protein
MHCPLCCVIDVTQFPPNSMTVKPILFGPPRVFNFLARSADTSFTSRIFVMEALHVQPLTLQRFLFLLFNRNFPTHNHVCNPAHARLPTISVRE